MFQEKGANSRLSRVLNPPLAGSSVLEPQNLKCKHCPQTPPHFNVLRPSATHTINIHIYIPTHIHTRVYVHTYTHITYVHGICVYDSVLKRIRQKGLGNTIRELVTTAQTCLDVARCRDLCELSHPGLGASAATNGLELEPIPHPALVYQNDPPETSSSAQNPSGRRRLRLSMHITLRSSLV